MLGPAKQSGMLVFLGRRCCSVMMKVMKVLRIELLRARNAVRKMKESDWSKQESTLDIREPKVPRALEQDHDKVFLSKYGR